MQYATPQVLDYKNDILGRISKVMLIFASSGETTRGAAGKITIAGVKPKPKIL